MRRLFVEPPMEEALAAVRATPEEREIARAFSPSRRREFLAWRAVVRREVGAGADIRYNGAGAPFIAGSDCRIAVSHCPGRVAVCLSDAPCAVDIEPVGRDFSRVADRYMTACEAALCSDALWPAVAWCAKEAMYKYAGRRGLSLLSDLVIERVELVSAAVAEPGIVVPGAAADAGCGRGSGSGAGRDAGAAAFNPARVLSVDPASAAPAVVPVVPTCGLISTSAPVAPASASAAGSVVGRLTGRIAGGETVELSVRIADGFVVVYIL